MRPYPREGEVHGTRGRSGDSHAYSFQARISVTPERALPWCVKTTRNLDVAALENVTVFMAFPTGRAGTFAWSGTSRQPASVHTWTV